MNQANEITVDVINNLGKKVDESIINNKKVGIHINTKNGSIHNIVVPGNINISQNKVSISASWFEINLTDTTNLKYNEEENSFYFISDDFEAYIDFDTEEI